MASKYGHFDDDRKEYVITNPETPLPWINYLGNEDFFGIISNTGGGYCFYKDSRYRRITRYRYNNIPVDGNGRYLYIQDGETVWNPGWKPMRVDLDSYECRHGLNYSKITGSKNGLTAEMTAFVPMGHNAEIWSIKLKNTSSQKKSIRLWSFIEWCLWDALGDMTNFQRNFSCGEVEVNDHTIFHKTEYRERRDHYAFHYCSIPHSGFDTSRDAFVGVHYGLEMPQAIKKGECADSIAHGWSPIAVHQLDIALEPGEEKAFYFILGYVENEEDHKFSAPHVINKDPYEKMIRAFSSITDVENALEHLKNHWADLLSTYSVDIGDEHVSRMVNCWNQYQCMTTFNLSRSTSFYESGIGRGMGYRDSNQDILGFVHIIPDRARERILDIASTQLTDGTCFHQYQPLTKKGNADIGGGFNDDPLWLILSTSAYLKETGDFSILQEKVGFDDQPDADSTLMDHLILSVQYTLNNLGPHKLPLIGHADWNDCLNLNCFSQDPNESFQLAKHSTDGNIAESVMIAGLFCAACEEMIQISDYLGDGAEAKKYHEYAETMRNTIYEHGWDGEWFLRAYDALGEKIGSSENKEGQIFIESQGWCVLGLAGIDNGYALKALQSVKERLATKEGIVLQQPAYQTYYLNLGEISSYPPGYKENAGIFTHNNTWIQIAETIVGNGDQAYDYYMSICPPTKEEKIETFRAEPYVYNQMTAGTDAVNHGEGKNSWLTGTAAWAFVSISQCILGIKPGLNGLEIDPCIPKKWKEYSVTRKYRGATYQITVTNPSGISKGVKTVTVDGTKISGQIVPIYGDGELHRVAVVMGE